MSQVDHVHPQSGSTNVAEGASTGPVSSGNPEGAPLGLGELSASVVCHFCHYSVELPGGVPPGIQPSRAT